MKTLIVMFWCRMKKDFNDWNECLNLREVKVCFLRRILFVILFVTTFLSGAFM